MKIIHLMRLAVAFGFIFAATVWAGSQTEPFNSPSAYLPAYRYEFGSVLEGTEVLHDFVIQNKGNAPLKIIKVETT